MLPIGTEKQYHKKKSALVHATPAFGETKTRRARRTTHVVTAKVEIVEHDGSTETQALTYGHNFGSNKSSRTTTSSAAVKTPKSKSEDSKPKKTRSKSESKQDGTAPKQPRVFSNERKPKKSGMQWSTNYQPQRTSPVKHSKTQQSSTLVARASITVKQKKQSSSHSPTRRSETKLPPVPNEVDVIEQYTRETLQGHTAAPTKKRPPPLVLPTVITATPGEVPEAPKSPPTAPTVASAPPAIKKKKKKNPANLTIVIKTETEKSPETERKTVTEKSPEPEPETEKSQEPDAETAKTDEIATPIAAQITQSPEQQMLEDATTNVIEAVMTHTKQKKHVTIVGVQDTKATQVDKVEWTVHAIVNNCLEKAVVDVTDPDYARLQSEHVLALEAVRDLCVQAVVNLATLNRQTRPKPVEPDSLETYNAQYPAVAIVEAKNAYYDDLVMDGFRLTRDEKVQYDVNYDFMPWLFCRCRQRAQPAIETGMWPIQWHTANT